MHIKREKGHGIRATLALEIPELSQNWHIKFRPPTESDALVDEAERINWAQGRLPVPERAYALRLPGISMLITKSLEGTPSYKLVDVLEPEAIVSGVSAAIGLIRAADIMGIPFDPPYWATQQGAEDGIRQLAISPVKHRALHPDFAGRTHQELKDIINGGPGEDVQTLSHGDLCMPNVLLGANGEVKGIVDLGSIHVGNSRLDLAIMSWTVQAIMGSRWSGRLLQAYGAVETDQSILYNRLAYDLALKRPEPWAWTQTQQLAEQRERLSGN